MATTLPVASALPRATAMPRATPRPGASGGGDALMRALRRDVSPDRGFGYALPWAAERTYQINRAAGSRAADAGRWEAWDVHLPVGTPVIAAREGTVVAAVAEVPSGADMPLAEAFCQDGRGNHVAVRHADGTVGVYSYLAPGSVAVWPGQEVERGALLAASGDTSAWCPLPRLRFELLGLDAAGKALTFPFVWHAADGQDPVAPAHGGRYLAFEFAAPDVALAAPPARPWLHGALRAGEGERLLAACNAERAKAGVAPLVLDEALCRAAAARTVDMVERGYFDHANPDGRDFSAWIADEGVTANAWSENIAMGADTPEGAVAIWMASKKGHRENLLNPAWGKVGIGANLSAIKSRTWAQLFVP